MRSANRSPSAPTWWRAAAGRRMATVVLCAIVACVASIWSATVAPVLAASSAHAAPPQKLFATPEDAFAALVAAADSDDVAALVAILGPGSQPLVSSGDPVADEALRDKFVTSFRATHSIAKPDADRAMLETGADAWPFPIPLVKTDAGWRFDTDAGRQEILDRRIGANEIAAIQACLAYGDAQREYQERNPGGDLPAPYAQKLASTPGQRNGLFWESREGEAESPLGPAFSSARGEGYAVGKGKQIPYHGYYYRVLTAQGPSAPGGAFDYLAHGKMIGGFALVAYPAKWGASGVMTFVTSHSGDVFQKNLGPDTAKIAGAMKTFDPDASWTTVDLAVVTAAPSAAPAP